MAKKTKTKKKNQQTVTIDELMDLDIKDRWILVKWYDATAQTVWTPQEEFVTMLPAEACSGGFLAHISDQFLYLIEDCNELEECTGIIIPIGCVKDIVLLKRDKNVA